MLKIFVVQPGATDFDEQRRIKGSLDLPLNENGLNQVARAVDELANAQIDHVYSAPGQSARQTAEALAKSRRLKAVVMDNLQNLNHGLWHGKLIDEVKRQQPRVYRMWQDSPENVCPPEGETWGEARERVTAALKKIFKKHRDGVVAIVVAEPLATLVRSLIRQGGDLPGDLWKAECDCGRWELIEMLHQEQAAHAARA
jgi:phosphoserine phosphatase